MYGFIQHAHGQWHLPYYLRIVVLLAMQRMMLLNYLPYAGQPFVMLKYKNSPTKQKSPPNEMSFLYGMSATDPPLIESCAICDLTIGMLV